MSDGQGAGEQRRTSTNVISLHGAAITVGVIISVVGGIIMATLTNASNTLTSINKALIEIDKTQEVVLNELEHITEGQSAQDKRIERLESRGD